ncbi:hypothetical protein [Tardiphaga sp.]|uniref:hypothetical protein n=1 Tax=Tardiphaga sp. TaxID=1926292 RepID=UPI002636448A|nr:hypothetical protein [Tardiphaga sp.]MDB5619737.1 hypothetical protein [Tardiphaga sp.]
MQAYVGAMPERDKLSQRSIVVLVPALAVLITVVLGEPLFEGNDDTGLAMLGAGFGIAAGPEAHLIFSHYGYGLLLQAVRGIAGDHAHGWTTLAAIGFSMALCLRALFATGARGIVLAATAAALAGCVFIRPLLDPQFTITSSLLLGSAIACRIALLRGGATPAAMIAIYLAVVLGFLIRPSSAVLVLVVVGPALFWLGWRGPVAERAPLRRFMLATGAIAIVSLVTDHAAYSLSTDWNDALDYNRLRSLFNDFHRMPWEGGEAAYRSVGWSANDRAMFIDWYSLHPIYDLANIRFLVDAIAVSGPWLKPQGIWPWFVMVATTPLVGLLATATLALGVAARRHRVVVVLIALGCLAALAISGVTGRPPQFRVLFSIFAVAVLALLPFAARTSWRHWSNLPSAAVLVAVSLAAGIVAADLHRSRVVDAAAYRAALAPEQGGRYFDGLVISWGAALMWEWLITPSHVYAPVAGKTIPSIGLFTRMPVMRAALDKAGIGDLGDTLCRQPNVRLIAQQVFITNLQVFCAEHYGATPDYRQVFVAARSQIFVSGPSQSVLKDGNAAADVR